MILVVNKKITFTSKSLYSYRLALTLKGTANLVKLIGYFNFKLK